MPPEGSYLITCTGCVKDESGRVVEILATYDPDSSGGNPADGRKVKGATIHWVDASTAVDAQVRLYDNLFADENPDGGDKDFLDCLNPGSLEVLEGCKLEASLAAAQPADRFQFLRLAISAPTPRTPSPERWYSTGCQPKGRFQAWKMISLRPGPSGSGVFLCLFSVIPCSFRHSVL